jgi:hypothetical protein
MMAVLHRRIFAHESECGRECAFLFRKMTNDRSGVVGRRFADGLNLQSVSSLVDGHHTSPILRNDTFVALWWRSSSGDRARPRVKALSGPAPPCGPFESEGCQRGKGRLRGTTTGTGFKRNATTRTFPTPGILRLTTYFLVAPWPSMTISPLVSRSAFTALAADLPPTSCSISASRSQTSSCPRCLPRYPGHFP